MNSQVSYMKTWVALLMMMLSLSQCRQDLNKYLQDTKALVRIGKYEKALERYIWFYNHSLEQDSSMCGVRLSFALKDWMELAKKYEPAMKAMIETRDKETKLITDGVPTAFLFSDVQALNRTLNQRYKNVELFEFLQKNHPKVAEQSFKYVKEDLFETKRYDILRDYIKNPLLEYENEYHVFVQDTLMDSDSVIFKVNELAMFFAKAGDKNYFVIKTLQLIEFCMATGNSEAAKVIQQKALAVIDDHRLREATKINNK